ncbi:uncharacterized protein ATNIH1004_005408 [Aspergillus tanneri]|uniref:Uncharacterized protein n=1 Tax=Aspergillus tanneri TaxID=1220188 RepID=A0A5M9MP57_9EURO|nr:uncharacterized protein ATNIH1004_005408 [Aspergillus tanneri]KAA8646733.1 hypothetical protein ATNIH1004_005408 [Aspergillus tanneri]
MENTAEINIIKDFVRKSAHEEMERDGYTRFPLVTQRELWKWNKTVKSSKKITAPSFHYCKLPGAEFLTSDLEASPRNPIREKVEELIMQGPSMVECVAVPESDQKSPLDFMTAHPIHTRDAISFIPLTGNADWDNGLFAICTGSHYQSLEQFYRQPERDIHRIVVEQYWVLPVEGATFVQPSPNGGMKMIWRVPSLTPRFRDLQWTLSACRLLDILSAMAGRKPQRIIQAKDIFDCMLRQLNNVSKYFEKDHTQLVLRIDPKPDQDIRLAALFMSGEDPRDRSFYRLLGSRSLALEREQWPSNRPSDRGMIIPKTYGIVSKFLRSQGLEASTFVREALRSGQILLRIEEGVGVPGISLCLLPVFPKLQHLPRDEEAKAIQLLKGSSMILRLAARLSLCLLGVMDTKHGTTITSMVAAKLRRLHRENPPTTPSPSPWVRPRSSSEEMCFHTCAPSVSPEWEGFPSSPASAEPDGVESPSPDVSGKSGAFIFIAPLSPSAASVVQVQTTPAPVHVDTNGLPLAQGG